MTTMLHAPPETGAGAPRGAPEEHTGRKCPECLGHVDNSLDYRKMFCTEAHRLAFHNRQLKRGRSLVVPALASRITRGGTRRRKQAGKWARQKAEQLMQRWIEEDRAEGRMAMDDYYELQNRLGFKS